VHKPELLQQQREITRRLSAVRLTEVTVNQTVVAEALEEFLKDLKRPVLRIRWARDSRDAHAMVTQAEHITAIDDVKVNPGTFRGGYTRKERNWIDARHEVLESAQNEVLAFVSQLMYENSVFRESGTTNHNRIWLDGGNALDFAARAAAECAWAYEYYETEERFRQYGISEFEKGWFPFVDAYEAGLWQFWLTDSEVIALSRPILRLNGSQVHSDNGPAVYWPEGKEQYFVLNGVQVPQVIVEPASELDPRLILHESNAAVRREIVNKIGVERICSELSTSFDKQDDYELLMLDLEDDKPRPFLRMKNPGTGACHVEGVAPELRTVAAALAWRNQTDMPPTWPGSQRIEGVAYRWYQQGEVTIKPVPKIPHRATLLDHRVLAEGRTTKYKHVALANDVRLFQHEEDLFMRAPTGTTVAHRKDDAVQLPPGDYVVGAVRVCDHFPKAEEDAIY
jgi:hypothetical protein